MTHRIVSRFILTALVALVALTLTACGQAPSAAWPGLISGDDTVYLTASTNTYAVYGADGVQKWSFQHKVQQSGLFGSSSVVDQIHAQPVLGEGLVYFGTDGGYLVAVDAATGSQKCEFLPETPATFLPFIKERPTPVYAGPALAGNHVIFAGTENKIYALKATGCESNWKPDWQVDVGSRVWGTPLVVGNTVYVGTMGHKLIALNAETGEPLWTFDRPKGALAGAPVFDNGTVYVGSFDNNLYSVDAASGNLRWTFDANNWIWEGPAVVSGTLYFGDVSGNVFALDAATQQLLWGGKPAKLDGAVRAMPLYAEGVLYVAADSGGLYALDAATGQPRWAQPFKVPSARFLTTPVMESGLLLVAPLGAPIALYGLNPTNNQPQWQFKPAGK